ncbi:Polycomb group RING finger protein 6 [Heterocephalus glaber]|uniref:Polycomb group RING finger protein 6 n=1 Tax=Heterocephalus glaber TaxID=10181 RepID=G5CAI9_HETGA|nr:Polycomb group RING finger protein 6 [Heterocephalus glaber]
MRVGCWQRVRTARPLSLRREHPGAPAPPPHQLLPERSLGRLKGRFEEDDKELEDEELEEEEEEEEEEMSHFSLRLEGGRPDSEDEDEDEEVRPCETARPARPPGFVPALRPEAAFGGSRALAPPGSSAEAEAPRHGAPALPEATVGGEIVTFCGTVDILCGDHLLERCQTLREIRRAAGEAAMQSPVPTLPLLKVTEPEQGSALLPWRAQQQAEKTESLQEEFYPEQSFMATSAQRFTKHGRSAHFAG